MSLVQLVSHVKLLPVILSILFYQLPIKISVHKENWLTIISMVGRWKSKMNNESWWYRMPRSFNLEQLVSLVWKPNSICLSNSHLSLICSFLGKYWLFTMKELLFLSCVFYNYSWKKIFIVFSFGLICTLMKHCKMNG
jgi:hypothetical protein